MLRDVFKSNKRVRLRLPAAARYLSRSQKKGDATPVHCIHNDFPSAMSFTQEGTSCNAAPGTSEYAALDAADVCTTGTRAADDQIIFDDK